MALSREGTGYLNELAVQAEHGHQQLLVTLPGDVETNPANYEKGKLKDNKDLVPLELKVYLGMPIFLTKNVNKKEHFVNGMRCVVEGWDERGQSLRVRTSTGHHIAVWHYTDPKTDTTYFPARPGYASTVLKFQGAELKHVTLWLNVPFVPGAAYTAMSRVSYGKDILIGGNVNTDHFMPANPMPN